MHAQATGSALATRLIQNWETERHYVSYAMPKALLQHQDSDTIMANLSQRELLDELSTAIAGDQVRKLKVSIRYKAPVADGSPRVRPHRRRTDVPCARRVHRLRTRPEVATRRLRKTSAETGETAIAKAARNLVLTEDFELTGRVKKYARDILSGYTREQLAALIGNKRVTD